MTLEFDKYYIEAEKQIDRIKNYLDSLGEDNLQEIDDLTSSVEYFCDNELNLTKQDKG
nr:MAG TPA: hypothetical protein [Caudoviricetes sp.]